MPDKLYTFHQGGEDAQFKYSSLNGSLWSNEGSVQNQGGVTATPASAVLNENIYLFYGRNNVFYVNSTADGDTFAGESQVPNTAGLNAGVAAVTYNGKIYLFYANPGSTVLMYRTFDGTSYSAEQSVPPVPQAFDVEGTPAAAVFNDELYVLCRGAEARSPGNTNRFWYCRSNGTLWQATQVDNTGGLSDGPGACTYSGALYVPFTSPDGRFLFKTFDGATWSADQAIPNTQGALSNPAASGYDNKLYLLYQGRSQPGSFCYKSYDGTQWADEANVPNSAGISNGPGVAVFNQ